MRKTQVPEDMSTDMKNILGVMSTRQLLYLIGGGALLYAYIPLVFQLTSNIIASFILCGISALPVATIVLLFGFIRSEKKQMYFDQFFKIKLLAKTQKGNWRKV